MAGRSQKRNGCSTRRGVECCARRSGAPHPGLYERGRRVTATVGSHLRPSGQVSTRRITMPVLIRHNSAMSAAQYDESAPPLVEQLRKQPGFLVHVTYEGAEAFSLPRCGRRRAAQHLVRRKREAKHSIRNHARSSRPSQRLHTVDPRESDVGAGSQPPAPARIGSNGTREDPLAQSDALTWGQPGPGEGTPLRPMGRDTRCHRAQQALVRVDGRSRAPGRRSARASSRRLEDECDVGGSRPVGQDRSVGAVCGSRCGDHT